MKSILLVDDSKEVFQMVQDSVSGIAQLRWAKCIKEAGDLLKQHTFNLLILDVELPDGNGIDFCLDIQPTHAKLPIFFLTSHTALAEKSQAFNSGADNYITKPFSPTELRDRIVGIDDAKSNMELLELFLKLK